jgi:hypothetical protein
MVVTTSLPDVTDVLKKTVNIHQRSHTVNSSRPVRRCEEISEALVATGHQRSAASYVIGRT